MNTSNMRKIRNNFSTSYRANVSGQALLLVVVMIGGVFFLVTAVAGLLMYYQVQQSNDTVNSTVAVFAADAGLERGLYYYFYQYDPSTCAIGAECTIPVPAVTFQNGASATSELFIPSSLTPGASPSISSNGKDPGARTIRGLETVLRITP